MSSSIFSRSGGAIAFFVQLDQEDGGENDPNLKRKIREHGGALVSNYTVADYVLVDPSTPTGADFIDFHTTSTRRIVSKDFIQESIDRRQLVSYSELILFVKEDRPVIFYLHESLQDADSNRLRQAILLRGGNPTGGLSNAQVVIHHAKWLGCKHILAKSKNIIRLETHQWLESCIQRNRFALRERVEVSISSSKSVRPPGRPRNEFTKKDDQSLVAWMAGHFGRSMAGRLGNRAYKEMVDIAEYRTWSIAHTWQSWRERYKKKRAELDPLIEAYIRKHLSGEPAEGTGEVGDELDQDFYRQFRACTAARKRQAPDVGGDADGSHRPGESYLVDKGQIVGPWRQVDGQPGVPQAGSKKRARVGATLEDCASTVSSQRATTPSSSQIAASHELQAWNTTRDQTLEVPSSDQQVEEDQATAGAGRIPQHQWLIRQDDGTLPVEIERELFDIAEEYNLSPWVVMAHFEQVEGVVDADKVVDATRQAIKQFVEGL